MHTKRTTYARALALCGLLLLPACGGQGLGRQPASHSAAIPMTTPTNAPTASDAGSGQAQFAADTTSPTTEPMATTVPTTAPEPTTEPEPTTVPRPLPRPAAPRITVPTIPQAVELDGMPALLRRIGGCESTGDPEGPLLWRQPNLQGSTASGAFQILDSTWATWAATYGAGTDASDYSRAMHAPPSTQLTVALGAYAAERTAPWASSRGCWG